MKGTQEVHLWLVSRASQTIVGDPNMFNLSWLMSRVLQP
jgi:hypothetical protein